MSPSSPDDQPSNFLAVVIVGNDALVEALPARPIQFALACRAIGFDVVLPGSWGDELVAAATLRILETRDHAPAVFCACPHVRDRLLSGGTELGSLLIAPVAPPVAAARYARAAYSGRALHLTYIGDCPAASAPDFDTRHKTREFLALLGSRGIDPLEQPAVFDDILPPDRRRHFSLPGGCPSPQALWQRANERVLVELEGVDLTLDLAQHLLTRQPALVDLASALGCACSGVTELTTGLSARVAVTSLEPPRSANPVIDPGLLKPSDFLVREEDLAEAGSRNPASDPGTTMQLNSGGRGVSARPGDTGLRPNPPHRPIAITPVEALHEDLAEGGSHRARRGRSLPETTSQEVKIRAGVGRTGQGMAPPTVADAPFSPEEQAFPVRVEAEHNVERSVPSPIESSRPVDQLPEPAPGSRRKPAAGEAIRERGGAVLRISTAGFPTVRRSEPLVSRLPRAYMGRRPGTAQHQGGHAPPAPESAQPRESPMAGREDREIPMIPAVERTAPAISTSASGPVSPGHRDEAWISATGRAPARPTSGRSTHVPTTGQVVDPLSGAQQRLRARLSARPLRKTARAGRPAVWKTLVIVVGALLLIALVGALWERLA